MFVCLCQVQFHKCWYNIYWLATFNVKRCTKELVEKADHPCNFSNYVMTFVNSESPMADGIQLWPCNPRVSGSIPGAGKLKKLLLRMKIHGLSQTVRLCSDGRADVGQQRVLQCT